MAEERPKTRKRTSVLKLSAISLVDSPAQKPALAAMIVKAAPRSAEELIREGAAAIQKSSGSTRAEGTAAFLKTAEGRRLYDEAERARW